MIQLHSDCLVLKTSTGDMIPCSTEQVTVELLGEAASLLDPEVIRQAATAILHYFKHDLGRNHISVGEFSEALERVLQGFGLVETPAAATVASPRVVEADLRRLACESGKGFELVFFARLRDELRQRLDESPQVLRFKGLRGCVKQLAGAQRWGARCQQLNDQIVGYLRGCHSAEERAVPCAMIVQ